MKKKTKKLCIVKEKKQFCNQTNEECEKKNLKKKNQKTTQKKMKSATNVWY